VKSMPSPLRVTLGALVVLLLLAAIRLGSSLPLPAATGPSVSQGVLLLDWRLRGEEAGECLRPTQDPSSSLPAHMQNPGACAGELPPYRLRLWVDGTLAADHLVRGGGLRGDRPLTVHETHLLPPGERELRILFERESPGEGALTLQIESRVAVAPGRTLLAVRRQDTGVLEIREPVRR
jgi:hypothetical protein